MNESINAKFESNGDGEMLRIVPQNSIAFTKSGTELVGNVEIYNIDARPVTYKIKTTAPEKFRVRPSTGVLSPGANITINVVLLQSQQMNTLNREKFLVMCMSLGNDMSTASHDLAELWKNTSANSASVEQHRLKCSLPINMDDGSMRNGLGLYGGPGGDMYGAGVGLVGGGGDKQFSNFHQVLSQLADSTNRMEAQVKFNRTLQWILLGLMLLLSIAIVYILKAEIRDSAAHYCVEH